MQRLAASLSASICALLLGGIAGGIALSLSVFIPGGLGYSMLYGLVGIFIGFFVGATTGLLASVITISQSLGNDARYQRFIGVLFAICFAGLYFLASRAYFLAPLPAGAQYSNPTSNLTYLVILPSAFMGMLAI